MSKTKNKKLFLVESGAKAKKISTFLPINHIVLASYGHIIDLMKKQLAIDVDNNFKPKYKIVQDESNLRIVSKIVEQFKYCDEVIFAADADREGEAIAWHLHRLLYKNDNPVLFNRITFNEISKKAILEALKHKTCIDMNLVNAQQARRIIDRLVGFKLSPLLWKYIDTPDKSLSAGRCQSAVLKLLHDHQNKIENYKPEYSYDIKCKFSGKSKDIKEIKSIKFSADFKFSKKIENKDKKYISNDFVHNLLKIMNDNRENIVLKMKKRDKKENSPPPFITSTLQQSAQTDLGFPISMTMKTAQNLYDKGLITYHRTDFTGISDDFVSLLKEFVEKEFTEKHFQKKKVKKVKGAQEAHEAIRITNLTDYIDKINADNLKIEEIKLYLLIFKRTIQSHMSSAIYDELTVLLGNDEIIEYGTYKVLVKILKFPGYLDYLNKFGDIHNKFKKNNNEEREKTKDLKKEKEIKNNREIMNYFENLSSENQLIQLSSVEVTYLEKNPPQAYNESTLVKKLEGDGIGRPSTYSKLINTLYARKYVEVSDIKIPGKDQPVIKLLANKTIVETNKKTKPQNIKKRLHVTELGEKVNNYLDKEFHELIDVPFTAYVENNLDCIATGDMIWQDVVAEVYNKFMPTVERLNAVPYQKKSHTIEREKWENTNSIGKYKDVKDVKDIFIKSGKFGAYIQLLNPSNSKVENISLQKYFEDNNLKEKDLSDNGLEPEKLIEYINNYYKIKKEKKKNHRSLGKYCKASVYLKYGQYGPYLQLGEGRNNIKPKFISMKGFLIKNKMGEIKSIEELKHLKLDDVKHLIK